MNRWIEHFIVIPLRWLRLHWKAWRDQQQRCKVCGYRDKFDFHVDDETWARVVPEENIRTGSVLGLLRRFCNEKGD